MTLEPDPDAEAGDGERPIPVLRDDSVDAEPSADGGSQPDLALPASAAFVPLALDFGAVEPYSPARLSVSLRAGGSPLQVESVSVIGPGFALDPDAPRGPHRLPPDSTLRWTVVFTPEIAGRESVGALRVLTEAGPREVPLRGRGAWSGPPCAPWSVEIDPAPPWLIEPSAALLLKAKPPSTVELGDVGLLWSAVETPLEPEAQPLERFDTPNAPELGGPPDDPRSFAAVFFAGKPGRYVFEARPLLPSEATCVPDSTRLAVHACPCPERSLNIRIGWRRSAGAPPGRALLVPLLVPAGARSWVDGISPGQTRPDWGRPGPLDDPRVDISEGDISGRIDVWVETGRAEPFQRLGLGVFSAPDSEPTTVDITVDIQLGDQQVLSLQADGIEAGRTFWDVVGLIDEPGGARAVLYDRLLAADAGRWPDLHEPLDAGMACDPWVGPRCDLRLQCRPGPNGGRCRF